MTIIKKTVYYNLVDRFLVSQNPKSFITLLLNRSETQSLHLLQCRLIEYLNLLPTV